MEIINQPNPITKPERNFGSVLSHSFEIYKGIFLYALLAMVLYIIASFAIQFLLVLIPNHLWKKWVKIQKV